MVKNLSAMQETWVQSLGQEDPLEEGMDPVFLPDSPALEGRSRIRGCPGRPSDPGVGVRAPSSGRAGHLPGPRARAGVGWALGPPQAGHSLPLSVQQATYLLCAWNAASWHDSWPYYRALPEGWIFLKQFAFGKNS